MALRRATEATRNRQANLCIMDECAEMDDRRSKTRRELQLERDIMHMCAHIYSESLKYFSFLSSVQYKSGHADILPGHGRAVAVISPAKFSVIAIYHSVSDHAITSNLSRYVPSRVRLL